MSKFGEGRFAGLLYFYKKTTMRYLSVLVAISFLIGCSSPQTELTRSLSGADSVDVNFLQPGTDKIDKTVSTTESKAIREMTGFLNGQSNTATKCQPEGVLLFYKQQTLIGNIVFSLSSDSCKQFLVVKEDGTFTAVPMSNKAADFLGSLKVGRSWY